MLLGAKYFTNSRTVQPIYICGCSDSIENNLIFIVSPYAHCSALLYFPAIHLVAGADVVVVVDVAHFDSKDRVWLKSTSQYLKHHRAPLSRVEHNFDTMKWTPNILKIHSTQIPLS